MKYLKTFNESTNYGDKHFGIPIFEYFPWYSYSESLNNKPTLKKSIWEFYKTALPDRFSYMPSVWWCENTIRQGIGGGMHVDNPHVITEGGPWATTLSGSSMIESHTIIVFPDKDETYVDGREFSAESWEDVEKLRLIHNLGKKIEADKYINYAYTIERFYEILKDAEDDTTVEFDYKHDLKFNTLGYFFKNGYLKKKQSDDEIIQFIRNYNGDVDFYKSLKKYLNEKGSLTKNQIDAVRKKPSTESLGVDTGKLCMLITNNY